MQIITQDTVSLDHNTLEDVRHKGPFKTLSEAVSAVRDIVGARHPGGLSDHTARQVTFEMMARSCIHIDPAAREVAANAHIALACKGQPLSPSVAIRLFKRGPFSSGAIFEQVLADTIHQVFGLRAKPDLVRTLSRAMIADGTADLLPEPQKMAS
jgi:Arc/MetJ family transcription regulator